MKLTMGCDPELFLFDNLEQRIVPAVGKVGGTKWKPMKVDGGMVQLDGTLVEFGIDPNGDIQTVINAIRTKLDNRFHGRYELRCGDTVAYDPRDIDPNSTHLDVGCSPQFKFDSDANLIQVDTGITRTDINRVHAGGHIHIGFTEGMNITDPVLLRSCKMFVDALSNFRYCFIGRQPRRIEVLGGDTPSLRIRVKPYGFELRNPSALWLADSRVFPLYTELCQHILKRLQQGVHPFCLRRETQVMAICRKLCDMETRIFRTRAKVPAKYQKTLPLDY